MMTDDEFDAALVAAFFALMGEKGVLHATVPVAAGQAGLDLVAARRSGASMDSLVMKFGELADAYALTGAATEGSVRDRLFDMVMRRFDFLQMHRAGVLALLKYLPLDPALALCMAKASLASMGWLLEAAGVPAAGPMGAVQQKGLLAVWAWGVRAWAKDESADLTATMAAVDTALNRADQLAARFCAPPAPAAAAPMPDAPPGVA
jgi:hypothetical protein